MLAYPVSTRVNSPKNEAPKLLAKLNEPLPAPSYRRSQGQWKKGICMTRADPKTIQTIAELRAILLALVSAPTN